MRTGHLPGRCSVPFSQSATIANAGHSRCVLDPFSKFSASNFVRLPISRVILQIEGRLFFLKSGDLVSDNLQETIRESVKAAANASGDAGSVEQHKLTKQIAADKYLASKAAATYKKHGRRFNKLVPPGAD